MVLSRDGMIMAEGRVSEVCTADMLNRVLDIRCQVVPRPDGGGPLVVPLAAWWEEP